MGLTTPQLVLPYPEASDPDNVPSDIQALAERIEELAAAGTLTMPPGLITPFGGTVDTVPLGWVFCDGRPLPRLGTYAALFAVIDVYWGGGDGSSTFNVPDLRGRFLAGSFTLAGTPKPVGEKGGSWDHVHGAGSLAAPDHLHGMQHTHWMQHQHGGATAQIPAVAGYNNTGVQINAGGVGNFQQAGHPHPAAGISTDSGNRNTTDGTRTHTDAADRGLGVTGSSAGSNPSYALVSYIIKA